MNDGLTLVVDAETVERALARFQRTERKKAERGAVSDVTKEAVRVARSEADPGASRFIKSRIRTRGDTISGRVYIDSGGYRLLAHGTKQRQTRQGYNRGFVVADPFMERTARRVDPLAHEMFQRELARRLEASGLRVG